MQVPLLEKGDIIIDGGNSEYQDSQRRTKALQDQGILFVGSGVSGGEEGARWAAVLSCPPALPCPAPWPRYGPSLMPGGNPAAWPAIKPIFQVTGLDKTTIGLAKPTSPPYNTFHHLKKTLHQQTPASCVPRRSVPSLGRSPAVIGSVRMAVDTSSR